MRERRTFVELTPGQKAEIQEKISELAQKKDSVVGFDDQLEVGSWEIEVEIVGRTCRWTRGSVDYESKGEIYLLRSSQTGEMRLAAIDEQDGVAVTTNNEFKSLIGGEPEGWRAALRRARKKRIVSRKDEKRG